MRPYWQRHPIQARIAAALILLSFPVVVAICLFIEHWDDIVDEAKSMWSVLLSGKV